MKSVTELDLSSLEVTVVSHKPSREFFNEIKERVKTYGESTRHFFTYANGGGGGGVPYLHPNQDY